MGQQRITIISNCELSREGSKRLILSHGLPAASLSFAEAERLSVGQDDPLHLLLVEGDSEAGALAMALRLRGRFLNSPIALLCPDFPLAFLQNGLAAGINGFLTRDMPFAALLHSLRLILTGQKILPTRCIEHLMGSEVSVLLPDWNEIADHRQLSQREVGVLHCLVEGDANKVISRRLNIAEPTVKVHIKAILRKLNVGNRTQAAVWAVSRRTAS
ncbi:LuxR C-terminal-related transcriptional regulator [Sphingomonas sp. PR090111-T3T-6A]|uniref:LuxR C-terminal-related transcriptional regulator n=1 Tax=Sphingomonas sp. PR090111-T3T-6A TaxID=685778 RepID=UPI0003629EDC|nr:response regulator transcription factor [Sphingomonas sp. PR090111-T3T-6A]